MDRTRYQRFFHMLREEDRGYGLTGACNGYVKIEIKDGKGKMQAFVQNMREPDKGTSYAVYLLKAGDSSAYPIRMGILEMQKNKGELVAQFDPDSIKNSGIPIEKIGTYAVILERGNGITGNVICPLIAGNEDNSNWRIVFPKIPVQHVEIKYSEKKAAEERKTEQEDYPVESKDQFSSREANLKEQAEEIVLPVREEEGNSDTVTDLNESYSESNYAIDEITTKQAEDERIKVPESEVNTTAAKSKEQTYNRTAINNIQIEGESKSEVNMLERVKEALGRHFEEFQPFQRRRFSYRWWKVNNPVYLNNVLYVNRVKSPIFFNPLVIMAHFKHKHIIMGTYVDRQTDKEYIVCGTPGIYGIDERPFGELCRWMPKEGERPRYGGYGYWVVYIDPSTGRLVTL